MPGLPKGRALQAEGEGKRALPVGVRCKRRNVSLPQRYIDLVQRHADYRTLNFSDVLRRMIDEYVERHPLPERG